MTDATHDPSLRSFVQSANGHPDFPIQNLPLGVFSIRDEEDEARIGVAIGDRILDLERARREGLLAGLDEATEAACGAPDLNELMSLGPAAVGALRRQLVAILAADSASRDLAERCLVAQADADMLVPASIGDYTDFYASVHHATNVGSMFRPDNALLPNYKWVPIGYHGRASSIVISGTPVVRPKGQTKDDGSPVPQYGPSKRLDYEMEVGVLIGRGNDPAGTIAIAEAIDHAFGFCLVNDWSARDVQAWEYQPLGPFLAKNFATTVSPWVVTTAALEPFRTAALARAEGDPQPLPHLLDEGDQKNGGFDITLEVWLSSAAMRERNVEPVRLSRGSFTDMYWTVAQLIAHHASNGCNLQPGDLLASGTVSGATKDSRGCMLELTWRGTDPVTLPTGEQRRFLEDGDEVIMRGYCEREGYARIGFGECRGVIAPAR